MADMTAAEAKLFELVAAWPANDGDEEMPGADVVEWLGGYRQEVMEMLKASGHGARMIGFKIAGDMRGIFNYVAFDALQGDLFYSANEARKALAAAQESNCSEDAVATLAAAAEDLSERLRTITPHGDARHQWLDELDAKLAEYRDLTSVPRRGM